MKIRSILTIVPAMTATLFFAACGGGTETEVVAPPPAEETAPAESAQPPATEPAETAETEAEAAGEEGTITITGNDQMRFSLTEFTVSAGSEVEIAFENVGSLPKEAMGHNLVVLTLGTDPIAFSAASAGAADNNYIAPELEEQVIAGTAILGPGESETLTFTAPQEPGEYPFVCSFPGHTPAGMRGVMIVE